MPNFHCESKVMCRRIFTMEIWYLARMQFESLDWDHTLSKAKTLKPPCKKSPESQCQNHVFTADLQKLRFYQNKGLSLDKHYGVSSTFPHVTKL